MRKEALWSFQKPESHVEDHLNFSKTSDIFTFNWKRPFQHCSLSSQIVPVPQLDDLVCSLWRILSISEVWPLIDFVACSFDWIWRMWPSLLDDRSSILEVIGSSNATRIPRRQFSSDEHLLRWPERGNAMSWYIQFGPSDSKQQQQQLGRVRLRCERQFEKQRAPPKTKRPIAQVPGTRQSDGCDIKA